MPKLTPYGAFLKGVLVTHVAPRLAKDAKLPDFSALLSGAPMTNRVTQRAAIAQAVQTTVKPHLAADADLDDVAELLEAVQRVAEGDKEDGEVSDDLEPNSAIPMVEKLKEEDGLDEHPAAAKIKEICARHNLPPEVCAELAEAVGETEHEEGGLEETEEERMKREEEEKRAKDKKAMDAGLVSRTEVDKMIANAVKSENQRNADLIDAREFVRPWVGNISMACDSAESVMRETLKMLGDPDATSIHASALKSVISRTPKPGDNRNNYAFDATLPKGVKPASERFANAGRVTILG